MIFSVRVTLKVSHLYNTRAVNLVSVCTIIQYSNVTIRMPDKASQSCRHQIISYLLYKFDPQNIFRNDSKNLTKQKNMCFSNVMLFTHVTRQIGVYLLWVGTYRVLHFKVNQRNVYIELLTSVSVRTINKRRDMTLAVKASAKAKVRDMASH